MNFRTALVLAIITVMGSLAQAADFNLGIKSGDQEAAQLSVREEGATIRVRAQLYPDDAQCGLYRKELCKVESQVSILDLTLPADACHMLSTTLLACDLQSIGRNLSASVILTNGKVIELSSIAGQLRIVRQEGVDYQGKIEKTVLMEILVMGNRADGLDPLINRQVNGPFTSPLNLEEVRASLF